MIHIQNDPVNFPFTVETQRGPYRVKFDDLGHTIGFHRQIPLRYPNPLPKSEYPQYSANDWYEAAELFNSFVTKADLADKSKTSLPEVGTVAHRALAAVDGDGRPTGLFAVSRPQREIDERAG